MKSSIVCIVDDDASVRAGVSLLLESVNIKARAYDSAESFLAQADLAEIGCLIVDLRMPGMSGIELQAELANRNVSVPIVFLTAHVDIPSTVRAIRGGAEDFLTKPVDGAILVDRVRGILARVFEEQRVVEARRAFEAQVERLTVREREILALAITGKRSKDIARQLNVSHRTVEVHRHHIFQKTGVTSMLELAQKASAVGVKISLNAGKPDAEG